MKIVEAMRAKYAPVNHRKPCGSDDIECLCRTIEQLVSIIRGLQRRMPEEDQNDVESALFWLDNGV